MVFVYFATVAVIVILCAVFLGRLFAWIVQLVARYACRLDLRVESFGFLTIKGIKVKLKGGRTIEIERVALHTKWDLPNSKKLFTIFLENVLLSVERRENQPSRRTPSNSQSNFVMTHKDTISSFLQTFCKYVAVSVSRIEVVLQVTNGQIVKCHLDNGLEILANSVDASLQSTLTIPKAVAQLSKPKADGVEHLAEISVAADVEASFQPLGDLSTAVIQVRLKTVGLLLSDALLTSQAAKVKVPDTVPAEENNDVSGDRQDLQMLLAKVLKAPKHVEVVLETSSITLLNQEKRKLTAELGRIITTFSKGHSDLVSNCDLNVGVSGVTLSGTEPCKLCTLNRLRFCLKLSKRDDQMQMVSSLSIESFHNNYVHEECIYWLEYFKSRRKNVSPPRGGGQPVKSLPQLHLSSPVSVDIEMVDCSTSLYLKAPSRTNQPLFRAVLATCSIGGTLPNKDSEKAQSASVTMRLENAYVYVDAVKSTSETRSDVQSVSYTLTDNPGLLPSTHRHVWGRVLALGSCSIKFNTEQDPSEKDSLHVMSQLEASCLCLEWSHQVCRTLVQVTSRFVPHGLQRQKDQEEGGTGKPPNVMIHTELRISAINVFYLGTQLDGIDSFVMRSDMVTIATHTGAATHIDICGVKVARMIGLQKAPYRCLQSAELEGHCLSVPFLSLSMDKNKQPLSVSVSDVEVEWNPTFHMALNDRIQELTEDAKTFKELVRSSSSNSVPKPSGSSKTRALLCELASFKLCMKTSPSTSFGVEVSRSTLDVQDDSVLVTMTTASVLFDDQPIFMFEDVSLNKVADALAHTRQQFKSLETSTNHAWIVSSRDTHVLFPFEYDFATSRSELVNVTKMLKALHKKPRGYDHVESLPPDLWLKFENIVLEMEDDPFEVKLGDNYVLLLDEARHWSERRATLETRLSEIRKTPGNLLTVKREDELYSKLEEKNAQIYIQRSKALYEETPMRKNLLRWEFRGLDLKVLADQSYHGKERAVRAMSTLNQNSPYPSGGLEFSTLWCRTVLGTLTSHCYRLRDYPRPIFSSTCVKLSGTVVGAEQTAADRAKREAIIEIDKPWGHMTVQRSLTAFKFYYDLDFDVDTLEMAWGVDTDPATTMVTLAFDNISKASADPSKPLPWFDKVRLLMHGRLHLVVKEWLMYFSATRNPYDITERLEVDWTNCDILWTNGRLVIDGDFDLQTRTASKYDDRRVLHLPAFKVCADMKWLCSGDPNDHHTVMPCAPEKIPELAPNQAHDSYALFRSQNLSLNLSLETAIDPSENAGRLGPPTVYLYASTFRWFKKYQAVVFQSVSRPIKRGLYFNRPRMSKQSLGRHYKKVTLSLRFPALSVWYWGSFTQQRGVSLSCGQGSLHTQYRLHLHPLDDGLTRRQAADWTATKLHIDMSDVTSHVYGVEQPDGQEEGEEASEVSSIDLEPTKYYFLTAERLEYSRQDTTKNPKKNAEDQNEQQIYGHRLVCHGLKGAWSQTSRQILFGLFEAYTNAEILKKNLSADALKVTIVEQKKNSQDSPAESGSVHSRSGKSRSVSLLQKLVSERDTKFTAYTEEGSDKVEQKEIPLQGVAMCNTDDVIAHSWHIKLVNSQILLKGIETRGCVLVTAGSTTVLSRLHQPVWDKGELFNKKTWAGTVENVQYFATVSTGDTVSLDSIPWLDTTVITGRQPQKTGFGIADLADIVGSGEAVGGVITAVVGGATAGAGQEVPQLQRIVARCGCDFYYVNFSTDLDPLAREMATSHVPPSPANSHLRVGRQQMINTFTIRHKLLEISTNSSQYAMLLDIVNNVVLYTEPKKKEAIEKLQRMRFHLQLSASEDQRGQILLLQNAVRSRQTEMRSLQRELYEVNLIRKDRLDSQDLTEAVVMLEREIAHKKELLNSSSSELKLIISAYKDFQLNLNKPTPEKAPSAEPRQLAEAHFNHVSWQLNQEDGQLEIADVKFMDFSYSKTTLTDATIEHRFEVNRCNMRNLLPNSIYKDVLGPHDVSGSAGRAPMVRLYCRVKPPVGGIGVKEHFEVNVCPLNVQLTRRLFQKGMSFFFPQRAAEYESDVGDVDLVYKGQDTDEKDFEDRDLFTDDLQELNLQAPPRAGSIRRSASSVSSMSSFSETDFPSAKPRRSVMSLSSGESPPTSPVSKDKGKKKSTFYRKLDEYDDLEKMKERASKNNSFIYVKVTEVALCVSYKGEKEKNITDVRDFNLTIPTLEYHNRTWTWHDLLMAMKKDCINVLVSQVIKEKLHWKTNLSSEVKDSKTEAKEEDKAKLLFGDRSSKTEKKKAKKGLLSKLVKLKPGAKPTGLLQADGAAPEPVNLEGSGFDDYDNSEEEQPAEVTPKSE